MLTFLCLVTIKASGGYYSPSKLSFHNFYLHAVRWKLFWFLVCRCLTVLSSRFHSLSWQFNQSNLEAVFRGLFFFFFLAKCACPFLIRDSVLWKIRHHGVLGPCHGAASISTEKPLQSSPCGVSSLSPPWCWYGREVLELRLTRGSCCSEL